MFRRDGGWSEVTQLIPDDASADLRFGQSVGVADGTLVAGAFSDDPEKNTGSAYVFAEDGEWSQQTTLAAPKEAYNGFFGSSAAAAGGRLLVGGSRLKRAYLYGQSDGSWSQTQEFSPDGEESRFGADVALTSDWAVVGDPFGLNEENLESGAVYFIPV